MVPFNFTTPEWANPIILGLLAVAISIIVALIAHTIVFGIARRLSRRSGSKISGIFLSKLAAPTRWIAIAVALNLSLRSLPLAEDSILAFQQLAAFILPLFVGWFALACLRATQEMIVAQEDISQPNNLSARRKRTRIGILSRIGAFAIIFLTVCMMLIAIPGVRSVGVTLMASAGLAGLAVGAAAQPALKNLIAGIQMAFSEPIRIDDVVIIEGEWGRIEEIRLTYVAVKIWDERRLIVPVAQFLERPFQNWTRENSALLSTAFVYVDQSANVAQIREHLRTIVEKHPKWDGRVIGLQVTDIKSEVMELRALVSAADASQAFDLRCDVREALMAYIAQSMPDSLPKRRAELRPARELLAIPDRAHS
jgi:small-conductance mechanosensitive channel